MRNKVCRISSSCTWALSTISSSLTLMIRALLRLSLIRTPAIRSLFFRKPILPVAGSGSSQRASRYFHRSPPRLTNSNEPKDTQPESLTLSQRLKVLVKSYGWYAIGVYIILSALDFGVAFAGINLLGAEQVSRIVASVKDSVSQLVHSRPLEPGREDMDDASKAVGAGGQEGLYAMLVLAYTIHKTVFLPVRVGLTAACTPKLVGLLTRRGWIGTSGVKRAAVELRDKYRNARDRP
jgi:N-terminal acetyltransferase 2